MPIPLFNRFGNTTGNPVNNQSKRQTNLLVQIARLNRDPGFILEIMLQNEKINQQQYNELWPYRNNPQMIYNYLLRNGKADEINQAESMINNQINSN